MKAFSVSRRLVSVLSLLLAIMMLFAACGPDENASQPDENDDTQVSSDVTDESTPEDTADTPEDESKTTQNNSKTTQNNTSKSSTGKNDAFNNANDATFYKSAPKGGTIKVLMWRSFHKSEQLLVDQYEKLTGTKIEVEKVPESEYATKLVTMVASKNSPDVICFSSNNFPGVVTKALQPLNPKVFQLDSDCWSKDLMDAYKINGYYFGVAQPQSWSCQDCNYVTYYSPAVLKSIGQTTTPYELYKQGKWNWETQAEIARKAKEAGKTGIVLQEYDLYMHSAGQDFVKYDGKQYTNLLKNANTNKLLINAWTEVAKLNSDEAVSGWDISAVQQDKAALFTGIAYGLYNEGDWFQKSFAKNLEAVPVAGPKGGTAYTPIRPKVWGVPKYAKNAEGAAYFLRYFLDTSALNFSSTFHNTQFETIYNTITKTSTKKSVMHGWGVTDYVTPGTYLGICDALAVAKPQQVATTIEAKASLVNAGVNRANRELKKIG